MHKPQVKFHKDETSWWVTCVHCGEERPREPLPVTLPGALAWMLWNTEHPCMLPPNSHYSDADRRTIRKWNGLEP